MAITLAEEAPRHHRTGLSLPLHSHTAFGPARVLVTCVRCVSDA